MAKKARTTPAPSHLLQQIQAVRGELDAHNAKPDSAYTAIPTRSQTSPIKKSVDKAHGYKPGTGKRSVDRLFNLGDPTSGYAGRPQPTYPRTIPETNGPSLIDLLGPQSLPQPGSMQMEQFGDPQMGKGFDFLRTFFDLLSGLSPVGDVVPDGGLRTRPNGPVQRNEVGGISDTNVMQRLGKGGG